MGLQVTQEMFVPAPPTAASAEAITRPSLSFWADAWRRLKQNRLATASMYVLVVIVLFALVAPILSHYRFSDQDLTAIGQGPSWRHLLGTDDLGRDLWTRLWVGGRVSLCIGLLAGALDLAIGVLYGGISGYFGGKVDDVMMRIVEILFGIPYLLMIILLMVVMGQGLLTMITALGLVSWIGMARLVRGQVLQLKEQEYVLAARTLGAGHLRLIVRHVIPGALGPIIVALSFTVPGAIFAEAFLSFLGLGVPLPMASWGTLADDGFRLMRLYPWMLIFPSLVLMLTILAFYLFGDGLRDALDPTLRNK